MKKGILDGGKRASKGTKVKNTKHGEQWGGQLGEYDILGVKHHAYRD